MKRRADPFKLGLFVLAGAIIVVGSLIWIGAAHLLQSTRAYETFFKYSVRGLKAGSEVDYLGLQIGQVSSISLARNGRLIKVVMKLDKNFKVKGNEAVEMKLAGITGGHYLAIVKAPQNLQEITPKIDFPTHYPVIPSAPGTISEIENTLEDIFKKIQDLNTQGVFASLAEAGKNAGDILKNKDIPETLNNLKEASASLKTLLSGIGRPENVSRINQGIENFATASSSVRKAGASISRQIEAIPPNSLAEVAERMEKAARETEQVVGSMGTQMEQTISLFQQSAQQINQVLSDLEGLVQSLRTEPGRILKQPSGSEPFRR